MQQRMADQVAGKFVLSWSASRSSRFCWPGAGSVPIRAGSTAWSMRGGGVDHRLPVRAGPGDADVDHGGHRQRGHEGRFVPRCRRAIENLRKVDTLIVDKTGTLTEGKPAFDRAVPVEARARTKCCG